MVVKRIGKRYGGPWYANFAKRMVFELGVNDEFSDLKVRTIRTKKSKFIEYTLQIEVPNYGYSRNVRIKLFPISSSDPKVYVDGPTESPHRFEDDSLCIWYPWDPKEMRWEFNDGLLHLLVLIQAHLFREAWWRDTNEWLGPEVDHEKSNQNKNHISETKES